MDFYDWLKQDIAAYEGRHDDLIYLAPEFYRLLTNLLDDARLPGRLRPLVSCAIAYFILPADVIPEELYGPYGYVDDIFLCAFVADQVREQVGMDEILAENWEGEAAIIPLVQEVLAKEQDLIGDERERILRYTGCDRLLSAGEPVPASSA
ncbi:MAG: hypothetical protein DRI80_14140 [Chloroflexota bacterium]|nr:MAG: hypothetical protein DRI80_14140 [Chloroflexota bacterium]